MAHFAGCYLLAEGAQPAREARRALEAVLGGAEGALAVFEDRRLWLAQVDYGNFGAPGYWEQDGRVAALAGELILSGAHAAPLPHTEELRRVAASLGQGPLGLLPQAHGTFALCGYDQARGQLLLATDPLGARPLYYCVAGGVLYFATAFKFLLHWPDLPRHVDLAALAEQYAFCYPLNRRTLLQEVAVLRDAEFLQADHGQLRLDRYFRWETQPLVRAAPQQHLERCYAAFQAALASRSPGPGPHLALLSGGLDSRCVVAGLQALGKQVHAFNCAQPGTQDYEYAGRYAAAAGVPLTRVPWSVALPQYTPGQTTSALLRHALAGCRGQAVFSGDGGGETVGFLMMTPSVMTLLEQGRIEAAIQEYTRGHALPRHLLRREAAAQLRRVPAEGMRRELERLSPLPPQKAMQLFLLRNDLRRHLHGYFEDLDQSQVELRLPFYDQRVLAAVIGIAPPLDAYLGHAFYHQWLEHFPEAVRRLPWQTYPGHAPCPLAEPAPPVNQWQFAAQIRRQTARRFLRQAVRAAFSGQFPGRLMRRGALVLAAAASAAGASRYDYVFKACLEVLAACRLDARPAGVALPPAGEVCEETGLRAARLSAP